MRAALLRRSTGHADVQEADEPETMEPEKASDWQFAPLGAVPTPRFAPLAALLDSGFVPDADNEARAVRMADVVVSEAHHSPHRSQNSPHHNHAGATP
jgi:hypothetical protein